LLKTWKNRELISDHTYNFFKLDKSNLPRVYGFPKIHKQSNPLRVIVSSIGSPLHNLAIFLHKIFDESLEKPYDYIKNNFQLVKDLIKIKLSNSVLISSRRCLIFYKLVNLVIKSIDWRWHSLNSKINLPKDEFFKTIVLVLNFTYLSLMINSTNSLLVSQWNSRYPLFLLI